MLFYLEEVEENLEADLVSKSCRFKPSRHRYFTISLGSAGNGPAGYIHGTQPIPP
jgi:hypothetical protein